MLCFRVLRMWQSISSETKLVRGRAEGLGGRGALQAGEAGFGHHRRVFGKRHCLLLLL